jgi:hypothetical protein
MVLNGRGFGYTESFLQQWFWCLSTGKKLENVFCYEKGQLNVNRPKFIDSFQFEQHNLNYICSYNFLSFMHFYVSLALK